MGVMKDMDLYYRESFTPQVTLLEFETTDEGITTVNHTKDGLTSAVFTEESAGRSPNCITNPEWRSS